MLYLLHRREACRRRPNHSGTLAQEFLKYGQITEQTLTVLCMR